jgi:hypothetical protein
VNPKAQVYVRQLAAELDERERNGCSAAQAEPG